MNKLREWYEMFIALLVLGTAALVGLITLLILSPGFWLVVIAYILVTRL